MPILFLIWNILKEKKRRKTIPVETWTDDITGPAGTFQEVLTTFLPLADQTATFMLVLTLPLGHCAPHLHRQLGNHISIWRFFICHCYKCLFLTCNYSKTVNLLFSCVFSWSNWHCSLLNQVHFWGNQGAFFYFLAEKKTPTFISLIIKQAGKKSHSFCIIISLWGLYLFQWVFNVTL